MLRGFCFPFHLQIVVYLFPIFFLQVPTHHPELAVSAVQLHHLVYICISTNGSQKSLINKVNPTTEAAAEVCINKQEHLD